MNDIQRWPARSALMVAHCAGMVDLVALPVWVGTLMSRYGLDAQQAGALATLFLAGAVLASAWLAPRFHGLNGRWIAPAAFGTAALAFFACSQVSQFGALAALHLAGGLANGVGLSVTHGTVARTGNPQRLFGIMQTMLGVFGVIFMAATPQLIGALGGPALFGVFGGVMLVASLVTGLFFPDVAAAGGQQAVSRKAAKLPASVWFGIWGISVMAIVQGMVFSFMERMGADRGFSVSQLNGLLIAVGLFNLLPGVIAALFQARINARVVVLCGATAQGVLAMLLASSTAFEPYAAAGAVFVAVMVFTHIFAFGQFAALDPSGRAAAATPAMTMIGAAVGPILGGTLVKLSGYPALGMAALVLDVLAFALFMRLALRPAASYAESPVR
ncbi:MAG: MFS transporter [Pigmentiphaga sp.]|uniref:MFS transporter n=1 Tax=Pigmentiphaga daeguensis TaxID=414049 RepID=A0ABN1C5Q5_9BURK